MIDEHPHKPNIMYTIHRWGVSFEYYDNSVTSIECKSKLTLEIPQLRSYSDT